jgi:UDPglucose 6-dehydrogenase
MRVAVVGTGYVGLVTGACLAHLGHHVTCLDTDEGKIVRLTAGHVPIYEPGLDDLVAAETAAGRLAFHVDYASAVPQAEAVFICVGTPALPTGQSDTSAVRAAALAIGENLGPRYCVIINKSTVPIGSVDWVGMLVRHGLCAGARDLWREGDEPGTAVALSERNGGAVATVGFPLDTAAKREARAPLAPAPRPLAPPPGRFDVVSNPEFLREGTAIADALQPDRIVVGAESPHAVERMHEIYAPLLSRAAAAGRKIPFIVTDHASAELIKYAANAFLATKISFINEIANICEHVGADVHEVARGIGLDARIGRSFLAAGIGWGGSCFPKDLSSLVHTARDYGYEAQLLQAVRQVNREQPFRVVRKLQERLKLLKGKIVAIWGLAFKPGTDDVREAPSLLLAARLAELGAEVRCHDPRAGETAKAAGLAAEVRADPYEASRDASAVVLVTEWPEFTQTDWPRLRSLMARPLIVDGRNALDRALLLWHGFEYCGIGR